MINVGQFNLDNTIASGTITKITAPTGNIQTISASAVTDDGVTLKYNAHAVVNADGSPVAPAVIYSAAGTPLPAAATALNGATAIVSDATTPTYGGTYTSGGAVYARVLCTGTEWITA